MYFFIILLTAIALSLDAFSLSIIYGTILNNKKTIIKLSIIVGIFHFFMPLLGFLLKNILISKLIESTNIISFIIFLILGIQMFISKEDGKDIKSLSNLTSIIVFAFTVSLDSFSIGIALSKKIILISIITFALTSAIFTYLGLRLGKIIKKSLGNLSTKIGGIILILLSFYHLFT